MRALQERASTTFNNQQRPSVTEGANAKQTADDQNLAKNYSISSGNEAENINALHDSNYDDNQGLSASDDNSNSNRSFNKDQNLYNESPAQNINPMGAGNAIGNEEDEGGILSSPEGASHAGVNGESGIERSYIQSSMDAFDLHSSQDADEEKKEDIQVFQVHEQDLGGTTGVGGHSKKNSEDNKKEIDKYDKHPKSLAAEQLNDSIEQ